MVRAVLFDLDETLHDRTGSLVAFLRHQHASDSVLKSIRIDALKDAFLDLDQRGRVEKIEVYRSLLKEFGLPDAGAARGLSDDYDQNFWRFAQGFDGLDRLLPALRVRGLRTGIITNGKTGFQMKVIRALGLEAAMDTILVSEAEGVRKPDPEIFYRAAQRLDVAVGECLFVGDNPVADVLGARAAGMLDVWFPNGAMWPAEAPESPGRTVQSLVEVLEVVDELRSG